MLLEEIFPEVKTLMVGSGSTKGVDADVADKVTDENLRRNYF